MEVAGGLLKVNTEVQKAIIPRESHSVTSWKAISSFSRRVWHGLGLLNHWSSLWLGNCLFPTVHQTLTWLYLMKDADGKPQRWHWVTFNLMSPPNRQCVLSKGRHNYWAGSRQDYRAEPNNTGESSAAQWLRDGAQWVSSVIAACRWILYPSSNTSPTLPTP